MARRQVVRPEPFVTPPAARERYEIVVIENVPADEVDRLIIVEQQTNPLFLWAEQLPEGDGEYTVVKYYRRG